MANTLEEIRSEFDRIQRDRRTDASIQFQRKMLMACVTGIEFLNTTYDPLNLHLDGWSESMHENLTEYDDVFEELSAKYSGKTNMPPELKLMFMVGGSGLMFHMSRAMFSSHLPGFDQVMKQNPDLMRQFQAAAANTMQQQQQASQRSAGGGLFGMFAGMMGGGGSASASASRSGGGGGFQPPPQGASGRTGMKGPQHVDDILRDLHGSAFASGGGGAPANGYAQNRVEIISNASEGDSDFPDDVSINEVLRNTIQQRAEEIKPPPRGGRGSRGGGRGGKGRGGATMHV
jgi:hypothetical protein